MSLLTNIKESKFHIGSLPWPLFVCSSIIIAITAYLGMMIPMFLGMCLAILVGIGIATLLSDEWRHAFFYTVAPVMTGGIGEGVLQLSNAYSKILNQDYDLFVSALVEELGGEIFTHSF